MEFSFTDKGRNLVFSAVVATNTSGIYGNATMPPLLPGEEIYDVLPGKALPLPWMEFIGYTAAVTICFFLIRAFYLWLTEPVIRERRIIQQSPRKMALRAIERLKLSPVWDQRQLKEISETLAHILKDFALAEHNIGIGAAATTDELLCCLQSVSVLPAVYTEIKDMMTDCDRIKYTGSDIMSRSPEELVELLHKIVTAPEWKK